MSRCDQPAHARARRVSEGKKFESVWGHRAPGDGSHPSKPDATLTMVDKRLVTIFFSHKSYKELVAILPLSWDEVLVPSGSDW